MKIVLGVDDAARARQTVDLLQALRFQSASVDVVHVLDGPEERYYPVQHHRPDLIARYLKMLEENANELLSGVRSGLQKPDFTEVTSHLLRGYVSNKLLDYASEVGADVLAVGSSDKGPIEGVLIGSVTRKAVISAKNSVLISKRPVDASRPMNVVLATDHSPYANKCIDAFIRWSPRGIGTLTVATVFPEQLVKGITSVVPDFKADVGSWVRSELERSNQEVMGKLASICAERKTRVESGSVVERLERVMQEEGADLLVLGAQGHGFVERMTLGSVALDMAIEKPFSVLVVRA